MYGRPLSFIFEKWQLLANKTRERYRHSKAEEKNDNKYRNARGPRDRSGYLLARIF